MRLPRWYRLLALGWLIIVLPFWGCSRAFFGESFFSLPALDFESWQALSIQFATYGAMLAPLVALPMAIIGTRSSRTHFEKTDNAQD